MSIDNSDLLLRDISRLYNNSNNCDIKIIVGQDDNVETFKAHSFILRVRSDYFNKLLLNKRTKEIFIRDINPHAFKIILE